MRVQAIIVLNFVAICLGSAISSNHHQVPKSISQYLRPEISCLLDREACNSNTEITRHALPNYLQGNTSHFLINQRIRINSIFRNIKDFYPNDWKTIKSNYERSLNAKQKAELDDALSKQVLASYPLDDLTREITKCFLNDQCNMVVANLKLKMYEMAAYGRCSECSDFTMEWLYDIENKLETGHSAELKRAIIAKETSYDKVSKEKRIHQCLDYPQQTAVDCVQAILSQS